MRTNLKLIIAIISLTIVSGCGIQQYYYLNPIAYENSVSITPVVFKNNADNGSAPFNNVYEGIGLFYKFYPGGSTSILTEQTAIEDLEGPDVGSYIRSRQFYEVQSMDHSKEKLYFIVDFRADPYSELVMTDRLNSNLTFSIDFSANAVSAAASTDFPKLIVMPDPSDVSTHYTINIGRGGAWKTDTSTDPATEYYPSFNISKYVDLFNTDTDAAKDERKDLPAGLSSGSSITLVMFACAMGLDEDYNLIYSKPTYIFQSSYTIP